MTLVEMIVAIAILAIVLAGMTAAFTLAANVAAKSNTQAKDSESAEKNIAGTQSTDPYSDNVEINPDVPLPLGDYEIPGKTTTYTEGDSGYTFSESYMAEPMTIFFGYDVGEFEDDDLGIYRYDAAAGARNGKMRFVVPSEGYYRLEVWGAQGGGAAKAGAPEGKGKGGGKGGYAKGSIYLQKDAVLYLYAGKAGAHLTPGHETSYSGVFGGGGDIQTSTGTQGGGASDIRIIAGDLVGSEGSLYERVIVAGGGGGGGWYSLSGGQNGAGTGGFGGGLNGGDGQIEYSHNRQDYITIEAGYLCGLGGGQSMGGAMMNNADEVKQSGNASPGVFGKGGKGRGAPGGGGSGGGGWYGGGGGLVHGGGGGSGWVFTKTAFEMWTDEIHKPQYILDNYGKRYYLYNVDLRSGGETVPDPMDATSTIGRSGDGFVKITRLG